MDTNKNLPQTSKTMAVTKAEQSYTKFKRVWYLFEGCISIVLDCCFVGGLCLFGFGVLSGRIIFPWRWGKQLITGAAGCRPFKKTFVFLCVTTYGRQRRAATFRQPLYPCITAAKLLNSDICPIHGAPVRDSM